MLSRVQRSDLLELNFFGRPTSADYFVKPLVSYLPFGVA